MDILSVGVDRTQRNFEPIRKQVEAWKRMRLPDDAEKLVIYWAFVGASSKPRNTWPSAFTTSIQPAGRGVRSANPVGAHPTLPGVRSRSSTQSRSSRQPRSSHRSSNSRPLRQFRLKIPHCGGRKFPALEANEWATLASGAVEPSPVFGRAFGATDTRCTVRMLSCLLNET